MSIFRSTGNETSEPELSSSTRRWQGVRAVVMLLFVVGGYYAQQYNTEPSALLNALALMVSAAVVFAVTLPALAIQSRGAAIGEGQKVIVYLIVLPVVGYLSWRAATSFPIHWTTTEPETIQSQAQVRYIVRMGGSGCNHTAYVQSPQGQHKLCIEPPLSQRLEDGDQVELLVSESAFGKRYSLRAL